MLIDKWAPACRKSMEKNQKEERYELLKKQMYDLSKRLSEIAEIPSGVSMSNSEEEILSSPTSDICIEPLPNMITKLDSSSSDEEVFLHSELNDSCDDKQEDVDTEMIDDNTSTKGGEGVTCPDNELIESRDGIMATITMI